MTRKNVGAEDIYSGLLVRFRGVGEVLEYHDDYTPRYIILFRSFFGVAFLGRDHKYYVLQRAGFRHRILSVDKISAPLLKRHVVRRLSPDELEDLRKYIDRKRPTTDLYNKTVWRDIDRALNLRYGEPEKKEDELQPEFDFKYEVMPTGAKRDTEDHKPRPDLVCPLFLCRMGEVLKSGAKKYGELNWAKGISLSRCYHSLRRHLMQWELGDTSEDHLANAACNLMFMISMQERNRRGVVIKLPEGEFRVPDELIDMPKQHEEGRK